MSDNINYYENLREDFYKRINLDQLQKIEKNPKIKEKYLSAGSWGANNIMYVPILIMVSAIFWLLLWIFYLLPNMPLNMNIINILGALVVILASFLWFRKIKKGILKKYKDKIDEFPVCLAKIVMGNEEGGAFYCIYTTGKKRRDAEWLNHICYKIWHTSEETDKHLAKQVDSIFRPQMLATTTAESKMLPIEFTEGEKVFKKNYLLSYQPQRKKIAEQNNFFPVLYFNGLSVPVIKEEDLN